MAKHPHGRFAAVWKELKKRKVFQVALVYVLMGWGVMQVGELLFEALQVPEGAYTLLVILILLGFPVAVVLAWAYEITPEGVRRDLVRELRDEAYGISHREHRLDGDCYCGRDHSQSRRLAILPFCDMAADHDQDYFCEGLAEEIQNSLCNCDRMEIVARAHSARFRGRKIDLEQIRHELRVDALGEGSVRRHDGQYRISVQLVDIHHGIDIWVRAFDLPCTSEFEIQKRVAQEVARSVCQTFCGAEEQPEEPFQLALGYPLESLPEGGNPGSRS